MHQNSHRKRKSRRRRLDVAERNTTSRKKEVTSHVEVSQWNQRYHQGLESKSTAQNETDALKSRQVFSGSPGVGLLCCWRRPFWRSIPSLSLPVTPRAYPLGVPEKQRP